MSGFDSPSLFCFGTGYVADALIRALQAQRDGDLPWRFSGTTRDPEKRSVMREQGIRAFLFDDGAPLEDPELFLSGVTHLLVSTPPSDSGDPAFRMHADDILKIETLRWVGYCSSTAVYGDRNGAWIDEQSEPRPTSRRGSRRLKAEEQWLSLYRSHGAPIHIFRLAGIYGPGRSALDSVRSGTARRIDKPGHAFSRIHVDDIVQTLAASMKAPNPGRIYNLADDRAAPSHEVIQYACDLLNLPAAPLLPYDQADLAPITRSFYADNKRIRNDRIKTELGIILKYPDFAKGLEACLGAEKL